MNWAPPRLPSWQAYEIAKELLKIRDDLARLRHTLETNESGATDDPAYLAGGCVDVAEREVAQAARWLEGENK